MCRSKTPMTGSCGPHFTHLLHLQFVSTLVYRSKDKSPPIVLVGTTRFHECCLSIFILGNKSDLEGMRDVPKADGLKHFTMH